MKCGESECVTVLIHPLGFRFLSEHKSFIPFILGLFPELKCHSQNNSFIRKTKTLVLGMFVALALMPDGNAHVRFFRWQYPLFSTRFRDFLYLVQAQSYITIKLSNDFLSASYFYIFSAFVV